MIIRREAVALLLATGLLGAATLPLRNEQPERRPSFEPGPVGDVSSGTTRHFGGRTPLGLGEARAYVSVDGEGRPVEVGVTLDERALEGLPAVGSGHYGGHELPHTYLLDLPVSDALPFRFVELNWNPNGHEPDGVYQGVPHFDFHFYTIEQAEREAIVPTDPTWAEKANRLPALEYLPAHNVALAPPGMSPADVAVPMMGVHWMDVRAPELQAMLGNPERQRPFSRTFIHGSWDGRLIFWEPMVTRAHILAKKTASDPAERDEVVAIPTPERYQAPGDYPTAYRIAWDPEIHEYRIALTGFVPGS